MDLMNFVPSDDNLTVTLKVKDTPLKNADGTDMTFTVMSPYSKQYKEIQHRLGSERIKSHKDEDVLPNYEEFAIDLLAETTVDWNITWDGKTPKFDKALARQIYDKAFWIKMLVKEEQGKLVDFILP